MLPWQNCQETLGWSQERPARVWADTWGGRLLAWDYQLPLHSYQPENYTKAGREYRWDASFYSWATVFCLFFFFLNENLENSKHFGLSV